MSTNFNMDKSSSSKHGNPYDINSHHFNPDMYLQKLFKESNMREIMDQDEIIAKETQRLHSNMQTLVYENYNKFISATDTIRKMKNDFKQMEAEMDSLGKNMDSITNFSSQISDTLQESHKDIVKLSGVHSLLKHLQFLFKLPNKLTSLIEEGDYAQAVKDYMQTKQVLERYAHMDSFKGIRVDCLNIIDELKLKLNNQLKCKEASAKELSLCVELLLQLGEPADSLYIQFLDHSSTRLQSYLVSLNSDDFGDDLVDFVNLANNNYLCNLCLAVTSYNDLFITGQEHELAHVALDRLNNFIDMRMNDLINCVKKRVKTEQDQADIPVLVKALDKFYSKLCSVSSLFNDNKFLKQGVELIIEIGENQSQYQSELLKNKLNDSIRNVRQSVAQTGGQVDLADLLANLVLTIVEGVKAVLSHLTSFIQPELSFTLDKEFVSRFNNSTRGAIVEFLKYFANNANSFTKSTCPTLSTLLILSKLCSEFSSTHTPYLLGLVDEWFSIKPSKERTVERDELCQLFETGAYELINYYVQMQGNSISQMVKKSLDTRDWFRSLEPRTVRPAMKRVIEELTTSDVAVGSLFEEGAPPQEPGSDSRHHHHRSNYGSVWSPSNSHSYTHNLNKLFSDKIEVYSNVELLKVSILTGIIKIVLKTILECVRLKTFSTFGLQQIQVDSHYLQLYLWRYVSDENLIHMLLEDILNSAVHRCTNPVLMEPSIVEMICETG